MNNSSERKNSLEAVSGEIYKKGSKTYLKVYEKLYSVHFWDTEKFCLLGKEKVTGVLFHFKEPVVDHHLYVYGWVYPGTLNVLESEVKPTKSRKKAIEGEQDNVEA